MAKKVLLVEDDADLSKIYSQKLSTAGFEVIAVSDATAGLEHIKKQKPNIVLLDIMLPGQMNGFDLLEKLKADPDLKDLPIIVLTNLDTEKDTAMKIGANDYILKASLELNDLAKKVQAHI